MPQCIQCGAETPREDMFGAGSDLRCPKCAQQKRVVYTPRRSFSIKTDGPITKVIIVIAAIIFLLTSMPLDMTIGDFHPSLVSVYLAAFPQAVWSGEVWRLVTSTLVHGDIFHVIFNCYWLWRFGPSLEGWMGKTLYIGLFVVLAVSSVGAELMATLSSAIGLSGVVYGMFGMLYALRKTKDFAAALMDQMTVQVMVFWFFLCILLTSSGTFGVANWAHGVGALVGWLLGWAYLQSMRKVLVPFIAVVSLLAGGSSYYMPWNSNYREFEAWRGQFVEEPKVFRIMINSPDGELEPDEIPSSKQP